MVEQDIKNKQLKARIRVPENEISKMMQERENILINTANQIFVIKREADNLAKMRQTASPGKVRPSASEKIGKKEVGS